MSNIKVNLWSREFDLAVIYDQYEGENILPEQENALNRFIELTNTEEDKTLEEAKQELIEYIFKNDKEQLREEKITNIFKYIIPTSLYIERNEEKRIVNLMCEYKFDIEHGLAIQFENEHFKLVGSQDSIL